MTRRQLRDIALYVLAPLLGGLTPLAVIPAVTSTAGADGWASVAVALAVGVALSVVAELGWTIVGPQRVARDRAGALGLYDAAFASRLAAVAVLGPVASVVTASLVDSHRPAAALLAFAVVAASLNPTWYFIGTGQPVLIVVCETVPRVALTLFAAFAIADGAPLEVYGGALLAGVLACWALAVWLGRLPAAPSRPAWAAVPQTLREQGVLLAGRGITTVYKSLPIVLVGLAAPSAVAAYGAVDRPLRMGLVVLAAVPNRLQAWVGHPERHHRVRRARLSIGLNAALGLVAGLVFAVAMPWLSPWLFSGVVTFSAAAAIWGGVLVAVISLSRGLGLALVADDRAGTTTWASVAAAAVAVVGVPVGAVAAGVAGALAGLVVAETAGVVVQALALRARVDARAVAA